MIFLITAAFVLDENDGKWFSSNVNILLDINTSVDGAILEGTRSNSMESTKRYLNHIPFRKYIGNGRFKKSLAVVAISGGNLFRSVSTMLIHNLFNWKAGSFLAISALSVVLSTSVNDLSIELLRCLMKSTSVVASDSCKSLTSRSSKVDCSIRFKFANEPIPWIKNKWFYHYSRNWRDNKTILSPEFDNFQ